MADTDLLNHGNALATVWFSGNQPALSLGYVVIKLPDGV